MASSLGKVRVGVDIGGTFTDIAVQEALRGER
jgi:N-methylhydantoinase A/oxoprolinase/acetone carboxylase beta subunit